MSVTDYLTGLNNNRKYQEYIQNLLVKKERFSLFILDIDYFKKVNDRYGHPIGDEVLKELANRLKEASMQWNGIVSRNGGEEFSIILPSIERKESIDVAEFIRKAVEFTPIRVSTSEQLTITISGGISSFPENGVNQLELYTLADEALYIAKSSGRNKVVHINQK